MPQLDLDQFKAYDHPEELARVATQIPGAREPSLEVRLEVPAIHCAACTTLIEQALGASTQSVRAFATTQQVQIRWDPATTQLSALLQRLSEIGYPAIPRSREAASVTRTHEQRQALWHLFVAFFCMMQVMMYSLPRYVASLGELMPDQLQLLRWAEWMLTVPVVFFFRQPRSLRQRGPVSRSGESRWMCRSRSEFRLHSPQVPWPLFLAKGTFGTIP